MYEGMAGWMANEGQDKSAIIWTWLGTPGKPLTSAVAAPAAAATPVAVAPGPPRTGTGLAANEVSLQLDQRLVLVFAGLVALTLPGLALGLRRRTRRGR